MGGGLFGVWAWWAGELWIWSGRCVDSGSLVGWGWGGLAVVTDGSIWEVVLGWAWVWVVVTDCCRNNGEKIVGVSSRNVYV